MIALPRAVVPLGLVAVAAVLSNVARPVLAPLEARASDLRLSLRAGPPTQGIVAVPVDAAALEKYGAFPWPDHVVPEALAALHAAGARAAAFDFPIAQETLAVPDAETRGMTEVEKLEYLLRRAHVSRANELQRLRALATAEVTADAGGRILARLMAGPDASLTRARVPTILSFSVAMTGEEAFGGATDDARERAFLARVSVDAARFAGAALPEVAAIGRPADEEADAFGVGDLAPDADGTVRRHAPVLRHGDRVLFSLPLLAALRAVDADPTHVRIERGRLLIPDALDGAGARRTLALPLDARGRVLPSWAPDRSLATVRFADLLARPDDEAIRRTLAGAVALVHVAPTRGGLTTPLGPLSAGRAHAHLARVLASGAVAGEASPSIAAAWLAVLALLLYAAGALLPATRIVPAAVLVAVAHTAAAFALAPLAGVIVPFLAPLACIVLAGTGLAWNAARMADAERRRLDRLLGELRKASDDPDLRGRLERLELDVERAPIRLGSYRLTALIERGGMGAVFRAVDESLQRPVAVKIVSEAHPEMRERFRREAELVARISHPNVVQVYGVGEHAGVPYFAMELVEGESLARRLAAQGPMEPGDALRVAAQIARGLAAAHERGIVHRDVKPSNVLLTRGLAKIVDFGVAKAGETGLTGTGAVLGTADYMSPEQAQGLAVDHRTDLYSLGVTLFRMLAGALPFSSESAMGVIYKHVHTPAPDLREARPDLPPEIGDLLAEMLAKQPAKRPKDAASLAERLEGLAAELDARKKASVSR